MALVFEKFFSSRVLLYLLLCSFFFWGSPDLLAASPVISDISVYGKRKSVFLSATLKDGITKEINELIVSGATVPFRFHIALKVKRRGWIDKTVGKITLIKAVKYDLLRKVYKTSQIVKRRGSVYPGSPDKIIRFSGEVVIGDVEEIKSWISDLSDVLILEQDRMKPSTEYYIQVRADLRTTDLWVPFNYILFFLSFWDVDTDWATSSLFDRSSVVASEKRIN